MPRQKSASPDRVSDVTAANYGELGRLFIAAHEGRGFVVALRNGEAQGEHLTQTLPQWGAWLAFFRRPHPMIAHVHMLLGWYHTVPAEWPHAFTTDSTMLLDHEAGAAFERRWFDELNNPPMRGMQPAPDPPRTLMDARRHRPSSRTPFRPFPKVWQAFAGDPEALAWLDAGLPFQAVERASLILATQGQGEAREAIRQGFLRAGLDRPPKPGSNREPDREMCFVPPRPKFDISDFPDASGGASMSSGEWRDWAAREIGKQDEAAP